MKRTALKQKNQLNLYGSIATQSHFKESNMKGKSGLIISILVVIAFMCIRISYNEESASMLTFIFKTGQVILKDGLDLTERKWSLNFGSRMIEILMLSLCLILSASLRKWKVNTVFAAIFFLYGILISYLYYSIMDLQLFILSSTPFYILGAWLIFNNVRLKI